MTDVVDLAAAPAFGLKAYKCLDAFLLLLALAARFEPSNFSTGELRCLLTPCEARITRHSLPEGLALLCSASCCQALGLAPAASISGSARWMLLRLAQHIFPGFSLLEAPFTRFILNLRFTGKNLAEVCLCFQLMAFAAPTIAIFKPKFVLEPAGVLLAVVKQALYSHQLD